MVTAIVMSGCTGTSPELGKPEPLPDTASASSPTVCGGLESDSVAKATGVRRVDIEGALVKGRVSTCNVHPAGKDEVIVSVSISVPTSPFAAEDDLVNHRESATVKHTPPS